MIRDQPGSTSEAAAWPAPAWTLSLWAMVAAFGTYFCMYAFRRPFTVAEYADTSLWHVSYKTILITAQVSGYTLSKFLGIKIVSELPPRRRAAVLVGLIGLAHLALLGFALTPRPYNFVLLFLNGLPLGMVFGLVLGFLEGRVVTELLTAALCASFIVADGATKSVGAWLLDRGVSEAWMPFTAGALFLLPLLLFVAMLRRIPPPSGEDIAARSKRTPMTGRQRWEFFAR